MAASEYYGKELERVENPDPDTEERREMADAIEEMWPANVSEIADAAGYSSQHAVNTLSSHFRIAGELDHSENGDTPEGGSTTFTIEVPDDIEDKPSFIEGYVSGFRDGWHERQKD